MSEMLIKMLPISLLNSNKNNPRERIDNEDLAELTASIKENGILQPLTAFKEGEGYTLTMGHRRLAAAKLAGLSEIPVIISETKDNGESTLIAIQENGHRRGLSAREEAKAMNQLTLAGMDVETIAKKTGFCTETAKAGESEEGQDIQQDPELDAMTAMFEDSEDERAAWEDEDTE